MSKRWFQPSWVSPLVGFSFAAVGITGVLMLFHIGGHSFHGIHQWIGLIFVISGILHLLLNWRLFCSYLKTAKGMSMLLIIGLGCILLAFLGKGGEERHGHGGPPPWAPGAMSQRSSEEAPGVHPEKAADSTNTSEQNNSASPR